MIQNIQDNRTTDVNTYLTADIVTPLVDAGFSMTYINPNYKHGENLTRLHQIWVGMRRRCRNEKDDKYGRYVKRGISVCDDWQEYINFRNWAINNGYNETLSIDRINNDGDYCPENCRWTTPKIQSNNRSSNLIISFNGETMNITQWSERVGIKRKTLYERIKRGWDICDVLYKPLEIHKIRK